MEAVLFLVKAMSNLSLVFIIVNFVFWFMGKVPSWHLLLFVGVNLLSFCVYYAQKQGQKKLTIIILSSLAAVSLALMPAENMVYVLVNYVAAIYIGLSGIKLKTDYWLEAGIFGKGLVVVLLITFLLLVGGNQNLIDANYSSYMLIFLFASVYLLRTLRHLSYNENEREIRKINLGYAIATLVTAFVLGSTTVREFLWYVLARTYAGLVWILVYLLSKVALPVEYLVNLLSRSLNGMDKGPQPPSEFSGSPLQNITQNTGSINPDFLLKLQHLIQVAVNILSVILLLYGLFKLLRRLNTPGHETEEYCESREFISPVRVTPRLPKVSGLFAPRNSVEGIRHYYRRFLRLCLKRNIDILHSDTTWEICNKSEQHFDKEALAALRKIYIQARYGDEPCGEEAFNRVRGLFKWLIQDSRPETSFRPHSLNRKD